MALPVACKALRKMAGGASGRAETSELMQRGARKRIRRVHASGYVAAAVAAASSAGDEQPRGAPSEKWAADAAGVSA